MNWMKSHLVLLAGLLGVPWSAQGADAYVNGMWFDGSDFVARDVFVVGDRLTFNPPDQIDNKIDLAGAFVVPPFAEAHNHDLASGYQIDERINQYLWDGVFYAKMQSAFSTGIEELKAKLNRPDSVDVIFAFAPITGTGGHPIRLREVFFDRGYFEGLFNSKEEIAGIGYTLIESAEDLESKFPKLLAQQPDFIKLMLSYSEEYELRKDDDEFFGEKGLEPALVVEVVKKAHAAGLSVTAHVNSAADFHYAVLAGVDEIAHLPGVAEAEIIRRADAERAAERGVTVVTTVSLTTKIEDDYPEYSKVVMAQHAANLKRLKQAGVRIAIGSDMPFRDTSVDEALLLHRLGVFSELELLNLWCESTPLSIFPKRRIGRLIEDYEASFLALAGNPLLDIENVRRIQLRVKQGQRIEPSVPLPDEE